MKEPKTAFFTRPTVDQFNEIFENGDKKEITIYIPRANTPSQLGHPCKRQLVFKRTRNDAQPHSAFKQRIFSYGAYLENYIQDKLRRDGFTVTENQSPFVDHDFNISARIDCKVTHPLLGKKPVLCEIKTMNTQDFPKYNTPQDFLNSNKHYLRGYYTQIQCYLYLISVSTQEWQDYGIVVLFDKSTANRKIIYFDRDDSFIETEVLQKCEYINKCIQDKVIPAAEYDKSVCTECPFNHVCDVNRPNPGAEVVFDSEITDNMKELDLLENQYRRFIELDDNIKEYFKNLNTQTNKELFLIDNYEVNVKTFNRKSYNLPKEVQNQYAVLNSYKKVNWKAIQ